MMISGGLWKAMGNTALAEHTSEETHSVRHSNGQVTLCHRHVAVSGTKGQERAK